MAIRAFHQTKNATVVHRILASSSNLDEFANLKVSKDCEAITTTSSRLASLTKKKPQHTSQTHRQKAFFVVVRFSKIQKV